MTALSPAHTAKLIDLLRALIDQSQATVIVPPYAAESGYWFGGGNLVQDERGTVRLSGRYRNVGDSRTGLVAGARGLECALFRSDDQGRTFTKTASWSKVDLSVAGTRVVSIEGTALHRRSDGAWELYISTEKEIAYPAPWTDFQKPGTGVWVIDVLTAPSPDAFDPAQLSPVLNALDRPEYLHVKDPVVFDRPDGATALIFCSHPFTWASSNTGLAIRPAGAQSFAVAAWEMVSRGAAWDVAATRVTARMPIPRLGNFADLPPAAVYFYDGAECLRDHEQNVRARRRPRGYSCEEIGGACFGWEADFPALTRLSPLEPLFVSPHGTGVSRYVDVLTTADGLLATWEQGQPDGSQPLVSRFLPMTDVARLLA